MRVCFSQFVWGLFVLPLHVVCAPSNEAITASSAGQEDQTVKSKARLELIGRLQRKPGGAIGHMTVEGKRVYLVNEDSGLQLVDVSNPAAPKVTGSYKPKDSLGPIAASGNHAFVVEKDERVRVLDVSDSARPRVVGLCKLPDQVCGLAVTGEHVYVSMSDSLPILNVSRNVGLKRPRWSARLPGQPRGARRPFGQVVRQRNDLGPKSPDLLSSHRLPPPGGSGRSVGGKKESGGEFT
jgi:hypothetical protein